MRGKPALLAILFCVLLAVSFITVLAAVDEDLLTYIPFVVKPLNGIVGKVTDDGVAASGVILDLWYFNGVSPSLINTTATNLNGEFRFLGVAPLAVGQKYYVTYQNLSDPDRLYTWKTRELTSFVDGSTVNIGNFDIANVGMNTPRDTDILLPSSFQWTPRPATPSDSYEFSIFDIYDMTPIYSSGSLGYVSSYNLVSLPGGFQYCNPYFWAVTAYSPDGGYGYSFEPYLVTIHQAALSGIHGCVTENGVPVSGVSVNLIYHLSGTDPVISDTVLTSDGYFNFIIQHSLGTDEAYWVEYYDLSNSNRLSYYSTESLVSYTAGTSAFVGDFDIKNIALELPGHNVTIPLPVTFDWTTRPNTLWDDYELDLYDPTDMNTYWWTYPTLGYENNYTLAAPLPFGFFPAVWYVWDVWVYDLWNGYGRSYESRAVRFSSLNGSEAPGEVHSPARLDFQQLRNRQRSSVEQDPRWRQWQGAASTP